MKQHRRGQYSTAKRKSNSAPLKSIGFCTNSGCSNYSADGCQLWTECPMFRSGTVQEQQEVKKSKYHSEKVEILGMTFDSRREARRYFELTTLEKAGEIKNLRRQVKYVLIPTQRAPDTIGKREGVKQGRVLEKEISYYADYVYEDKDGNTVVEDVKGVRTEVYKLKRKLMLYIYHIQIKEI